MERIVPVGPDNVDDLDALFARGDPRTCQCAYVRLTNAAFSAASTAERRGVHRAAVRAAADGRAAGLIAYHDDEPVGWISFNRREAYDRLSSRLLGPVDDRPVWSVVCFSSRRRRADRASPPGCWTRRSRTPGPTA